jgi:hypothetical protein
VLPASRIKESLLIKTITQIRVLQRLCQTSITIAVTCIAIFLGAILKVYFLKSELGHVVENVFLITTVLAGVLILVLRYVRCPVCHNVYAGKNEPTLFNEKCRYCGRRSGDTG